MRRRFSGFDDDAALYAEFANRTLRLDAVDRIVMVVVRPAVGKLSYVYVGSRANFLHISIYRCWHCMDFNT